MYVVDIFANIGSRLGEKYHANCFSEVMIDDQKYFHPSLFLALDCFGSAC